MPERAPDQKTIRGSFSVRTKFGGLSVHSFCGRNEWFSLGALLFSFSKGDLP